MAIAAGKARCATCGKEKSSYKCGGCSREFCFNHLADHKQELSKQFDEIEVNRDLFRQTLTEQTANSEKHALIQQIDQWERDSIETIQHTAEEARQAVLKYTTGHIKELETKLNQLTDQLRESRKENDFNETDLHQFQEELVRLTRALAKPSNASIRQDSTPLITRISISVTSDSDRSNALAQESEPIRKVIPSIEKTTANSLFANVPLERESVQKTQIKGCALYSYDALESDEISFSVGDILDEIELIEDGWIRARNCSTGQKGLVPDNYIENLD